MKHKIMGNLVIFEKCLILNHRLQKLFMKKKIFSQRMLDDIMIDESPTLNYCMVLMSHGQNVFPQFY